MTTESLARKGWSRKKKAGTEVWFGRTADDIPSHELDELSSEIFSSYSGPDKGLAIIADLEPVNLVDNTEKDANSNSPSHHASTSSDRSTPLRDAKPGEVAGSTQWNAKSRKSYGISMSLYEQHPVNGRISGDPIADSFGICSRTNNAIMIVADGVNWGEKSKLAARCAIYGSMTYINQRLFGDNRSISNTQEAFHVLLKAVDYAHDSIIRYGGGQTTLCMALVLPVKDSRQFTVCIVNVGDSLAYVFSKYHGIREITTGSHDIQSERDIRDAGGAVGPVHGNDPELHNLTCSMTLVDPGDILYLTTDGISDNFDPVVTKIAVASKRRHSDPALQSITEEGTSTSQNENGNDSPYVRGGTLDGKPMMEPHERHQYAVKEMERIVHEFELFTEQACSAQELCGALLQHVLKLTDPKRKVLENPDLYGKKMKSKDRKRRDSEIVAKLSRSPGKLDHATLIGYDVGVYHGNDDEDYEVDEVSDEEMKDNPVGDVILNDHESTPSDTHDSHILHDDVFDACDNHGNPLSPESRKKKNSLKNLRLKIKSRFKSPGRKPRPDSIHGMPSPNKPTSSNSMSPPIAMRIPSASTSSTQSSGSLSKANQSSSQRHFELKHALLKEQQRQTDKRGNWVSEDRSERGRSSEEQSDISRASEERSVKGRASEDRSDRSRASEEKSFKGRASEERSERSHSSEERSVRSRASEQRSDRSQASEERSVRSRASEQRSDRSRPSEERSVRGQASEERSERGRSPGRRTKVSATPSPEGIKFYSAHSPPPPSPDPYRYSVPSPEGRILGRRAMRNTPLQSPTSNPTSPFLPSTSSSTENKRRGRKTRTCSDSSSNSDMGTTGWVQSPSPKSSSSKRRTRRALRLDMETAGRNKENWTTPQRVQKTPPEMTPNSTKNANELPMNVKPNPGLTYVLPETVIPYGIDLEDIMFIDDVADSEPDGGV